MKKTPIYIRLSLASLCTYGQLEGYFSYAQDGHVYFYI